MTRAAILFPLKAASLAAFFYAFGGWLVLPPGAILGVLS